MRVARMVIDVDDEVLLQPLQTRPRQVAAFHHDGRVELALTPSARPRCRSYAGKGLKLRRRRIPVDDAARSCRAAAAQGHRELRSDGVAVRPRVGGDDETLPLENGVANFGEHAIRSSSLCRGGLAPLRSRLGLSGLVGAAVSEIRSSCSIRSCCSIDSSKTKSSSGAWRSRRRWPICRRMNDAARSSAWPLFCARGLISQAVIVDARVLQVGADLHPGDRDEPQARDRADRGRSSC